MGIFNLKNYQRLEEQMHELRATLDERQNRILALQTSYDREKARADAAEQDRDAARALIGDAERKNKDLQAAYDACAARATRLDEIVANLEECVTVAEANEAAYQAKIHDARKERDEALAKLEQLEPDIERRASMKALAITQAQGVPAIPAPVTDTPNATTGNKLDQFRQIKDPAARARFWAEHRDEILT